MSTPHLEYAPPSAWRPTRRQVRFVILSLLASPLVLFVLLDLGCGLEHRSVLWPSIDTVYAPGFSESAFKSIRVGMTRKQVDAIMCRPLYADTISADGRSYVPASGAPDSGFLRYNYTGDGACAWGDFAWLDRSVEFRDLVVTQVKSQVYDD